MNLAEKKELNLDLAKWLKSISNMNLFLIKNLHSKIYVNEDSILITSMNLYEYSQINNHEIGVKLDRKIDSDEYRDTFKEIRTIFKSQKDTNYILEKIIEDVEDYSMGRLYIKLNKKYCFKNSILGSKSLYEFISDQSREIVDFDDNELYEDKSAVLRRTNLGKTRYQLLEKGLKKLSD